MHEEYSFWRKLYIEEWDAIGVVVEGGLNPFKSCGLNSVFTPMRLPLLLLLLALEQEQEEE